MKKRLLAVLLATSVTAFGLAGCGDKGGETAKEEVASTAESSESKEDPADTEEAIEATMTVWGPQEDQSEEYGNWMKTMCEQFAEEHPEWKLTFEYAVCPESDAKATVTQDPEGAADIYMFANDNLTALVAANGIAKLGGDTADYVKTSNSESIASSVMYEGDVYGVPFTGNTWFMYYDTSVFSEDDIKSLDTMLEKGKVSFPIDNSWYLPAFFFANGCTLFGDGTDEAAGVDFGGEKGKEVTEYLVDLVANPNFSNDIDGSGIAGLRDGKVNAVFSGSWSYNAVSEALGDNMGIAKLPTVTINGEEKQLKSYAGSKAIGVNPNCKNMQVAVALARYLGSEEAQKAHYELRSVIPCNVNLLDDEVIKADAIAVAQNETLAETSVLQPFVTKMDNVWKPVENFGKALVNHEITSENAGEMADKMSESANTSVAE